MFANKRKQVLVVSASVIAGALFLSSLGTADDFGSDPEVKKVLEQRCTTCHTLERVGIAMEQGRNLEGIITAMQQRGAVLSSRDRQILGTFWGSPTRDHSPAAVTPQDPIAEAITAEQAQAFERVIEQRCLLCHTRERIDDAISRKLPFEPIEQMMRARGATLTPQEQQTLQIFWGQPHR